MTADIKDLIIAKQEENILNLKEVGKLYFQCKLNATKYDVKQMKRLCDKGEQLESELASLKAQIPDTTINPNKEHLNKISEALALLNSMVVCGEVYSDKSAKVFYEACKAIAYFNGQFKPDSIASDTEAGKGVPFDEPIYNPKCDKCGLQNSENCNTCGTINPTDYLNSCIEKATPNLSKIKDVDQELAEIRGEKDELRIQKVFIEISPKKSIKVCNNCTHFSKWGVGAGTCLRPELRGNNNRTEIDTCYKFKSKQ